MWWMSSEGRSGRDVKPGRAIEPGRAKSVDARVEAVARHNVDETNLAEGAPMGSLRQQAMSCWPRPWPLHRRQKRVSEVRSGPSAVPCLHPG